MFSQELCGTELGFVGQDGGVELARVVVYRDEQIFSRLRVVLPFDKGQAFGVNMHHFAGIGFVIPLSFPLESSLDTQLNFSQSFKPILDRTIANIGAVARRKLLQTRFFQS